MSSVWFDNIEKFSAMLPFREYRQLLPPKQSLSIEIPALRTVRLKDFGGSYFVYCVVIDET
jgi:hypothetical protein